MEKKIKVIFCTLLFVIGAIQVVNATDTGQESTSYESDITFYASDSLDEGITEFYNDISSPFVILAHSLVVNTETFFIIPPGQWIAFDALGNHQGSIPFDSFQAMLSASPTTQIWNVTGVKNVKYGTDPSKPWSTFGNYINVGNQLRTCRYYWLEAWGSYLKCESGGGNFTISLPGPCVTTPQHIESDPIFRNVNHYLNFADCYYGVVMGVNHSCDITCDPLVKIDYQTGFRGSYAEAFVPQVLAGPYAPHKPGTPEGTDSGKPGTSYTYSTYTIDPNGDQISYMFDWDDGTTSEWLGPYSSGEVMEASHTWSKKGSYDVRVKAKDVSDLESDWSDPFPVTMPKVRSFDDLLLHFFERFPHAFPLLRHLLGL